MLSEHSQDDPSIAPYLNWAREVFSQTFRNRTFVHGDYIVIDTPIATREFVEAGPNWRRSWVEPVRNAELPVNGSRVKASYIRLPYGYAIIVTAYQDSNGYVTMVIHATVVNETEFMEFVVRAMIYPAFVDDITDEIEYVQVCMEPTTREMCEDNSLLAGLNLNQGFKPRVFGFSGEQFSLGMDTL